MVAAGLAAACAGVASAGGTQLSLVATAGRVWVSTGADVAELDSSSGRLLRRVATRYPYPLQIGASDGAIWASSVENGFVAGAVTRIPFGSGRVGEPLVRPRQPVLSLAVGSGTTWAVLGPWPRLTLASIDQATSRVTVAPLRVRVGSTAADDTGLTAGLFAVTVSQRAGAGGRVVALDSDGTQRWRTTTPWPVASPAAVGLGSVWAASTRALYRIDARTGRVEAALPIDDLWVLLAVGGGRVWVVTYSRRARRRYHLLKVDPRRMRIECRTALAGRVDAIAYGDGALWLARQLPSVTVTKVDPATLRAGVLARNLG